MKSLEVAKVNRTVRYTRQNQAGSSKKNPPKKGIWPITYRFVAVGTLVAYSGLGSQKVILAQSRTMPSGNKPNSSQKGPQALIHRFAIPAGLLEDVLPEFEIASGLHVLVTNPGVGTLRSPGVTGNYTNEDALGHLLDSTGVSYRFSGPDLIRLDLMTVREVVTVEGSSLQSEQVASAKYNAPLLDTPQSVSVVPREIMAEQNTTTLRDALRNVAGISLAAGEGSSQGDNLTIRGFTARNDIFLDGMRDFGSYYRDTFNQEQVQVLEGPSAITFGRGTTGGVVNEVSKTPEMNRFIQGNITGGSDLTRRLALDINEPISQLGPGTDFRLNVMGNDNRVAGRDIAEYRRYGFAPSLAFGLGTSTRVILGYFHQSEDDTPDYGIPWLFSSPAAVARNEYYGFRDANFLKTNDDIVTAKVEHDFSDGISMHNVLRYAHEARNVQITEPQTTACAAPPTAGCATLATPLNSILVTRNQINVDSIEGMLDEQLDTTFRFHAAGVKHTLVAGVEAVRETSDPARSTISGVPTTGLLNPNENQPYTATSVPLSRVAVTSTTFGAYVIDTVELGRKFDLIGGARFDRFGTEYTQSVAPATAFSRVDRLPSWRGAVVYKPKTYGSIYFDAGNSFNPSAESLSLTALTANTPPEKSLTFEAGTKWEVDSGKFEISGSIFRTDKVNAREPDPNNPLLAVLGGHQRVNGLQMTVSGYLTDRWQLLSSYALLAGRVVSSMYYPMSVGAPLANVPRNTFNFWSTYTLPWRNIEVGAGANFVDVRTASSTVPYVTVPTGLASPSTVTLLKEVPAYWVFNAMVKYPFSERTSLQLNLNNLGNAYYYDQIHPGHIVPGAGFSALVGINFKF